MFSKLIPYRLRFVISSAAMNSNRLSSRPFPTLILYPSFPLQFTWLQSNLLAKQQRQRKILIGMHTNIKKVEIEICERLKYRNSFSLCTFRFTGNWFLSGIPNRKDNAWSKLLVLVSLISNLSLSLIKGTSCQAKNTENCYKSKILQIIRITWFIILKYRYLKLFIINFCF